ncbi:unnamed protein product [Lactuca saligna]|uniref:Uncharacterized protein n=1 Tax=Lactuca saligna TaxID=75948 RepID=A0AA35YNG6_LACSI|nr:unnamed protein product [Lactuca saligna]
MSNFKYSFSIITHTHTNYHSQSEQALYLEDFGNKKDGLLSTVLVTSFPIFSSKRKPQTPHFHHPCLLLPSPVANSSGDPFYREKTSEKSPPFARSSQPSKQPLTTTAGDSSQLIFSLPLSYSIIWILVLGLLIPSVHHNWSCIFHLIKCSLLEKVRMEKLGDRIAAFRRIWNPSRYHDCKIAAPCHKRDDSVVSVGALLLDGLG